MRGTYQTSSKVDARCKALVQRLKRFLPGLHLSGGLKCCLISARSLLKKYGPLCGLLIELRKIISSLKWANAWLKVRVDGLDWYIIIRIFLKKIRQQLMINWHATVDVIVRVIVVSSDTPF